MASQSSTQKTRFKKWQNFQSARGRHFTSLVESQLVPKLLDAGFERVNLHLKDSANPVSGREIELERWTEAHVDSVWFGFDKYHRPNVRVLGQRRFVAPPHKFIRSAYLVERSSQRFLVWGKPWWLPERFWSEQASHRTIRKIECRLGQMLEFLESGTVGDGINRDALDLLAAA